MANLQDVRLGGKLGGQAGRGCSHAGGAEQVLADGAAVAALGALRGAAFELALAAAARRLLGLVDDQRVGVRADGDGFIVLVLVLVLALGIVGLLCRCVSANASRKENTMFILKNRTFFQHDDSARAQQHHHVVARGQRK